MLETKIVNTINNFTLPAEGCPRYIGPQSVQESTVEAAYKINISPSMKWAQNAIHIS